MYSALIGALGYWLEKTAIALAVVLRERKKIHCGKWKLALYICTYVWFDFVGKPLALLALFSKSTWKKIRHDDQTRIEDLVGTDVKSEQK